MDVGTGLVHTAPAHGPDDFLVALENNIRIVNNSFMFFFSPFLTVFSDNPRLFLQSSMVDADGRYNETAGPKFCGLEVLTEGVDKVLNLMAQDILHVETLTHSYPYDWRTKQPVIIRASSQWFVDINRVRDKVIVSYFIIRFDHPFDNYYNECYSIK